MTTEKCTETSRIPDVSCTSWACQRQFFTSSQGLDPLTRPALADENTSCGPPSPPRGRGEGIQIARRVAAAILVLMAAFAASCSRLTSDATPAPASSSSGSDPSGARLFTVPQDQMSHVQEVTVGPAPLRHVLRLTGNVAYNGFETTPVISQVSGPISRILILPGQNVRVGQPMLYVASPDFAQARTNYLKAKDAYALAQRSYARAQDLYQHRAIAQADLEQAESGQNQAQADLQSAEQALKVLGIEHPDRLSKDAVLPEVPVLAPIAGQAVERLVAPGQVIQAGATQVFTISNMGSVWVLVNVYEADMGSVHINDQVTIKTDAYPDEFHGRISYIGAALDPNSRTLQARIITQNPGEKLKKDMYVTATLQAGTIPNAMVVPDSAVLRDAQNAPYVYVEVSPNQFGERPVTIGESADGQTRILGGLKTGERVIADGSLFLQFQNSFQH
ncbi:MAG: efflux RND transporter periplasmic adaptor subunit [Acidobacteriota bacterium]|nr:efflux RND transporter periplasmic adaptor subunit [Acidobacteriota bacterium]